MKLIDKLKIKKELIKKEAEKEEMLEANNSIYRFYHRSLAFDRSNIGYLYLITPEEVIEAETPNGYSHKRACEEILSSKYGEKIHFENYDDFGNEVSEKYNTILIRIVSILINVSILYYPKEINEYQLNELKKFKEKVDEYNNSQKDIEKANIIFADPNGKESNDLDSLINYLENNLKKVNRL